VTASEFLAICAGGVGMGVARYLRDRVSSWLHVRFGD
jgi:hypothetical protein